ncbi:exodeoxyribonuclease III [Rickettsia bellii]|uniref:Exodeoxyribonuclease III n=3 Tax=Rickettsia bellii TaxID=33990 RepID=Q1RK28_RICBR|nr:exodeoxyribonuclease III [Rickettsia bellii]ABE04286.1 Exodeoxyribonuclease III [Rickettsia bellii RML369-C]ABV79676.1 Exodeoxyribonuclease III [Rickettsia bellii OSU 85-389]ARD86142.1 exodeoxyribonuclease III [Rickettsia bellii]KJV90360.1 exodeoxyribonuclease III [Rickettsia bellii str. RML An4]KJV92392.1 exodeoxyribonuclease III [Rickettsia bellii str. RML Mogi]
MKIATWNINSIKMRINILRDFLANENPDVLLLQELKCESDKFPFEELSDLPYNFYVHGQKSYNGVAILSKFPADEIVKDFPNNHCSDQARFIEARISLPIGFCNIISLYAPNGSMVGSDKFTAKLAFYDSFFNYLSSKKSFDEKTIIGGDFNIAPFDIDVYSPTALANTTCFTEIEQKKMRTILNSGFEDCYRFLHPKKQEFSWWDYRAGCFEQNKGMRIDMILGSNNSIDYLENCYMDYNLRTKEKPSDHIPVIANFKNP